MQSGEAFTQLVQFSSGFPDGAVTWVLRDGFGAQIATGTITPTASDVSTVITVSGTHNTLVANDLMDYRELSWSYAVGSLNYSGRTRYRIEAFLKFGVSNDGVRSKLGVEAHEVEDSRIDLVAAYASFEETVSKEDLNAVSNAYTEIVVCDAIEALAALRILPSLQVSLAQRESSGTNQYQRSTIQWEDLRAHLNELVAAGYTVVNPSVDVTENFGSIFTVAVRADPITGEG